jgi:molybdopterin-guanine dinucleotide biosynthesis protein A
MLTGVILAGGRSRRMGRDKAAIVVAGEPLWKRQARVLRDAGAARVSLVLRPEQSAPPDIDATAVQLLRDAYRDAGPIAGLHAALSAPPLANWYLVLAVDLPHAQADWFVWLSGFCDEGVGAIARHDTGYEPLAAIYPASAGSVVAERIARGEYSLQQLADDLVQTEQLRSIPLPARRQAQLANWNTPEDIDKTGPAPGVSTQIIEASLLAIPRRVEGAAPSAPLSPLAEHQTERIFHLDPKKPVNGSRWPAGVASQ